MRIDWVVCINAEILFALSYFDVVYMFQHRIISKNKDSPWNRNEGKLAAQLGPCKIHLEEDNDAWLWVSETAVYIYDLSRPKMNSEQDSSFYELCLLNPTPIQYTNLYFSEYGIPVNYSVLYIGTTRPPIGRVCTAEQHVLLNIITSLKTRTRNPVFATRAHTLKMVRVELYNRHRETDAPARRARCLKNLVTAAQTLPSPLQTSAPSYFRTGPMHSDRKTKPHNYPFKSGSWTGDLLLILYCC